MFESLEIEMMFLDFCTLFSFYSPDFRNSPSNRYNLNIITIGKAAILYEVLQVIYFKI